MSATPFANLNVLATHLRDELKTKKYVLLYAYNGTGKTRLSMAFEDLGRNGDSKDTLYFNAFTEDLFSWDNDLEDNEERVMKLNSASSFFSGLRELELENRIRPFLQTYADLDFNIDYEKSEVRFSREVQNGTSTKIIDHIKVSRGEENIFIWCFFLAIVEVALDETIDAYDWVKYIYIDDPISSLDEHNAITVASNLAQLLKKRAGELKIVISTHHTLFFNVLCNELKNAKKYFLSLDKKNGGYLVREEKGDTPFFHHVAALAELYEAERGGRLYTHHFNMLRSILEKTASFHGYENFSSCIKKDANDPDGVLHTRLINILSHGNYSLYEPQEMLEENKNYFKKILHEFINRYPFNPALFPSETPPVVAPVAGPIAVAAVAPPPPIAVAPLSVPANTES
jgi:hypothetical protein